MAGNIKGQERDAGQKLSICLLITMTIAGLLLIGIGGARLLVISSDTMARVQGAGMVLLSAGIVVHIVRSWRSRHAPR